MKKITKREVKNIKSKLWAKRILDLSSREICIYVLYRIETLMQLAVALSYNELRYNLCEVGPGKRRIDPWALDIVVQSKFFEKLSNLIKRDYSNLFFFVNKDPPSSLLDNVLETKAKIITKLQSIEQSKEVQENIVELISNTAQRNECTVLKSFVNVEHPFAECEISYKKLSSKNLLIRFYNKGDWIYPDSYEIWDLFQKAFNSRCIPILLAPRIHGCCFQVFKNLGMFARANYYLFISDKYNTIIESVADTETRRILDFSNLKFGQYENIKSELAYGEFQVLTKLLSSTIPKYHESFSVNLERMYKRLIPLLSEDLKELFNKKRTYLDMKERLGFIRKFVNLVPLGKITELKKIIKRNEKLARGLHYTSR
jgi:hypothetical protein